MVGTLSAVAIFLLGGLLSLLAGRRAKLACTIGPCFTCAGSLLALIDAVRVLAGGHTGAVRWAWSVPLGSLHLAMDPLSALFAALVALVCGLAAVYGSEYLRAYAGRKNLGASWFFFQLLAASMLLVVTARNGVFFLLAWEIMSLTSFFLVMFEADRDQTRRAGWIYLVATHLGTAFLLAMFVLLGRAAAPLDFELLGATASLAGLVFVLAVIGFGAKAGFMPLHVWLPEAHPAAPSHVSAVMSGVMIKMGLYGLLRILMILGPGPAWWGWVLLVVGAVSAVMGILFALGQQDLKRLLAYSSVENMGIITMGVGVGLLGVSYGRPAMAVLGFAGALLHVVNHALLKSLLFLGAGAVVHATGTRQIDQLGGLLKRMPLTGACFLFGAVGLCGLPPLNGFLGELLIYLGVFHGVAGADKSAAAAWVLLTVAGIGSLAMVGALAAAAFAKAFGMTFLGEPRSPQAQHAHEAPLAMRGPMVVLAGGCTLITLAAPWLPRMFGPIVAMLLPAAMAGKMPLMLAQGAATFTAVYQISLVLLALITVLAYARRRLLSGRAVAQSGTWDCGYVAPTARMQYTASSFTWPILQLFRLLVRSREEVHGPKGLFPRQASLSTQTPDAFVEVVYRPAFTAVAWVASKLRWLQQGRIQLYVLYVAITLLALLVWKLR